MTDYNGPAGHDAWRSAGDDNTAELPTRAHSFDFPERSQPEPQPSPYARPVYADPPSAGPQPVGPSPIAPQQAYGAPPAYAPGQVTRRYMAALPALTGGVLTAAAVAVGSALRDSNAASSSGDGMRYLRDISGYAWAFAQNTGDAFNRVVLGVAIAGVVTAVVLAIALAGAGKQAARGLVFFATWGAVVLGAAVSAALEFAFAQDNAGSAQVFQAASTGAAFGLWFGWLPALGAALLRIGRTQVR